MSETSQKRYVVIDTWVLEHASPSTMPLTDDEIDLTHKAVELLARIMRKCHRVVLDYDRDILNEYQRHRRGFVSYWLQMIDMRSQKVDPRPRGRINLTVRFDPNDMKFLEVASVIPCTIIISGDSDFLTIKDNREIKSRNIHVMNLDEALAVL